MEDRQLPQSSSQDVEDELKPSYPFILDALPNPTAYGSKLRVPFGARFPSLSHAQFRKLYIKPKKHKH